MTKNNKKTYDKLINESSLSRVWRHSNEHDCGALTAFRFAGACGNGEPYTNKENAQRNKSLLAKLKSKGYGVTKLHGRYPEGGVTKKEISYFVVNLQDNVHFEKDLRKLGEQFEQDSILYIPMGALANKEGSRAILIGTNHCANNWLSYGNTMAFEKGRLGVSSPIYTSMVNGRPFIFEEVGEEVKSPQTGFGHWAMHLIAEQEWQEIDV